jgi:hypothetical protein
MSMEFQGASFQNLGSWLLRLARLDLTVFDDVKDDVSATVPTLTVAVVASFLSGLGSWLWWTFQDFPKGGGDVFVKSFLMGSILQVGVWFLWVYVAAMVLSKGLGVTADLNRLLRTMGLAFAPMGIAVLMLISFLAVPFGVIAIATTLALTYVAIQAATDAQPQQVMLANIVGFLVFAVVLGILANISEVYNTGGLAPGLFFFNLNP